MTRASRPKKAAKSTVIAVRVSIEYREAVEKIAVTEGTTVSAYIAKVVSEIVVGKRSAPHVNALPDAQPLPLPEIPPLMRLAEPQAMYELRRIGININQIAHRLNGGDPPELRNTVHAFRDLFDLLDKPEAFVERRAAIERPRHIEPLPQAEPFLPLPLPFEPPAQVALPNPVAKPEPEPIAPLPPPLPEPEPEPEPEAEPERPRHPRLAPFAGMMPRPAPIFARPLRTETEVEAQPAPQQAQELHDQISTRFEPDQTSETNIDAVEGYDSEEGGGWYDDSSTWTDDEELPVNNPPNVVAPPTLPRAPDPWNPQSHPDFLAGLGFEPIRPQQAHPSFIEDDRAEEIAKRFQPPPRPQSPWGSPQGHHHNAVPLPSNHPARQAGPSQVNANGPQSPQARHQLSDRDLLHPARPAKDEQRPGILGALDKLWRR